MRQKILPLITTNRSEINISDKEGDNNVQELLFVEIGFERDTLLNYL